MQKKIVSYLLASLLMPWATLRHVSFQDDPSASHFLCIDAQSGMTKSLQRNFRSRWHPSRYWVQNYNNSMNTLFLSMDNVKTHILHDGFPILHRPSGHELVVEHIRKSIEMGKGLDKVWTLQHISGFPIGD